MTPEGVDRLFERLGTLFWKLVLVYVVMMSIYGVGLLVQKLL